MYDLKRIFSLILVYLYLFYKWLIKMSAKFPVVRNILLVRNMKSVFSTCFYVGCYTFLTERETHSDSLWHVYLFILYEISDAFSLISYSVRKTQSKAKILFNQNMNFKLVYTHTNISIYKLIPFFVLGLRIFPDHTTYCIVLKKLIVIFFCRRNWIFSCLALCW